MRNVTAGNCWLTSALLSTGPQATTGDLRHGPFLAIHRVLMPEPEMAPGRACRMGLAIPQAWNYSHP